MFTNLGCKLNQAELEDLARRFSGSGHQVVGSIEEAELHVVNTCTVTHGAARDSRKTARRGGRLNPALRTVLTGCYVESDPIEAAALAGVDLIVPNRDKENLLERVHSAFPELRPTQDRPVRLDVPYVPLEFGNSRALVKIEDGCNMQCSFCIIPSTRGPQRSREPRDVVRDVERLVAAGFPEIVITGVQISSYQSDGLGLFELTSRLLEETDVERLRLTSIAPWQFDSRLLDLLPGRRLCRHFHLSLQSGCDQTLRRMRRPYSSEQFASLTRRIRQAAPDTAITTDVIVGFPGETVAEFEASLAFVESQGFARVHAFPYSERPGTAAAALAGKIAPPETRSRMQRMLAIAGRSEAEFAAGQIGRTVSVLWEARRDRVWRGTSDNYLRVSTTSDSDLERTLAPAYLTSVDGAIVSAGPAAPVLQEA